MSDTTRNADWRTNQTQLPNPPDVGPQPPLRFEGGTLGMHPIGEVIFSGPDGRHQRVTPQDALKIIDQFAEPDRSRILFTAGVHYGITPWQMVDPHFQLTDEDRELWGNYER
jgi:hypothetical protein